MSAVGAASAVGAPAQGDQVIGATVRERLRQWRPFLLALGLVLAVALITSWTRPATSTVPLAANNPSPDGTQALAALLRAEGVSVATVHTLDDAVSASSTEGATVAVVGIGALTTSERARLAEAGGDVVVVGSTYAGLRGLTTARTSGVSADTATVLPAQCPDEDAAAAGELAGSRGSVLLAGADGAVGCFPLPGSEDAFGYATVPLPSGATLRVLADSTALANARLASAGNAALGVRALGHHDRLVWFDAGHQAPASLWETTSLPPWAPPVLAQLAVVVLALALVRGRRMGPVVAEPLPVVVRATETVRGRGRLYRRAGDRSHAARALRAGAATRLGRRLGVPPSAGTDELVGAVARATGRPDPLVHEVLAGPAPTDDRALVDLGDKLDRLESEAHTP